MSFDHANHLLYSNAEMVDDDVELDLPLLEQPVRGLLVLTQETVIALERPIAGGQPVAILSKAGKAGY